MKKLELGSKKCITCGSVMLNGGVNRVSQERWEKRIYCSVECRKVESKIDYTRSKVCPTCNTTFYRKENERGGVWLNKTYCSSKCANSRNERTRISIEKMCPVCEKSFTTRFDKVVTCSKECNGILHSQNTKGENHWAWNGGRVITEQGYVRVWVADDSPYVELRAKGTNHVLEHRMVMSRMIGRLMLPTEQVHHRNGIRDDNREENLELRTGSHGAGATVHCPTCTCNKESITKRLKDYTF